MADEESADTVESVANQIIGAEQTSVATRIVSKAGALGAIASISASLASAASSGQPSVDIDTEKSSSVDNHASFREIVE